MELQPSMSIGETPMRLSRHRFTAVVARLRAAGCVFADDEAQLLASAARTVTELDELVERRAAGLPVEHIVGWAQFCGIRIAVEPGVFVPRRRTEFLVAYGATLIRQLTASRRAVGDTENDDAAPAVVVDLCCGSGALGAALAVSVSDVRIELHAADLDPAAVRCAARNVATFHGHVYQGDLYQPLPTELRGRVDILVANPPYVPSEAVDLLPREARMHEHRVALDGGPDGLDVLRRVVVGAPGWLAPRGVLLVEASERQVPKLVQALTDGGLLPSVSATDDGEATVVTGVLPD